MEKPGGLPHCQTPAPRRLGKMWTIRWTKQHAVLPQTNLGQISTARWTDRPPPRKKKNLLISNNKKKTHSKEGGTPWARKSGGGEIPHNKPAGESRSSGTCPATRSGKACKSGGGRKTPQERGEDPLPMWTVNKHAGLRKQMQCHLLQCAWKGESL
jgi:hypothetical protein